MIKDIMLFAKRLKLKASGKVNHFSKKVDCKAEWYGNKNAGFYICPDFLNDKSIVYSFGIGEDISFDKEIITQHNCQVYGFDPTPKSINWLKSQKLPAGFHFYEFGISDKTEKVDFYLPKNPNYVSGSMVAQNNVDTAEKVNVQMKSIADIADELNHKHIDVLKMDIEGSEYDVIDNIVSSDIRIGQLLIEFHDRFVTHGTFRSKQAVEKLRANGYEIFGVSDSYEEVSFINKSLLA